MTELKRILLVEDSRNDVELILNALSENAIANEVVVVRDGEEALDYLLRRGMFRLRLEGNPIAILLDLKLPKIDGVEVLATLKSDSLLRMIPVIVLSSSQEEPDLIRCYELGTNAYVVKPIDFSQFVEVIKQVGLFWAVVNQPPPEIYSSAHSVS
ncbi:MAG: response regulator [Pegethrix bostrychoides GSE-TBD4-15B]|jgi:CheY-like chemotaxis protein|uniref:Response regulator n=1 Tax=Pegethrix bostrychoides GSE-TBD4-15B TaxID=2839662 RepID=A0A951PFP0_9CYAN|nr:response regulator [Pegethrix bostrychoides GSE-TBD4-15B]